MLIVVVACIENTQRRTSFQSPFDVTASTSTSDSDLGDSGAAIKSTETSAIVVAAVDSELLTPAEEPQLNSAAETAAAADDCEMSGRRVAETGGKTFYFVVVKCGFGTISGSYQRLTTQEKISQSD